MARGQERLGCRARESAGRPAHLRVANGITASSANQVHNGLSTFFAGCGAGEQEVAFAGVAGKSGGAFELGAGFRVAAQFVEEVGTDAGEKMVARQGGFGSEGVYECE